EQRRRIVVSGGVEGVKGKVGEYRVPGGVVMLEEMPLTGDGKLDRKRLAEPERGVEGYRGAQSPEEEILCGLYEELLGVEGVGLDDDFFELGGHSLLAVSLVSRVRSVLGVELEIGTVFDNPTVGGLSGQLRVGVKGREE